MPRLHQRTEYCRKQAAECADAAVCTSETCRPSHDLRIRPHAVAIFSRLLRIIGARWPTIEPPSQSDRANSQLLTFRLRGTRTRVNLFARPKILGRKDTP